MSPEALKGVRSQLPPWLSLQLRMGLTWVMNLYVWAEQPMWLCGVTSPYYEQVDEGREVGAGSSLIF